jgi:hypothetical protein
MKLRSHPSATYRGFPSWPPVWTREFGQENYPAGEVGILVDVSPSVTHNQCYLVIQYNDSRYVGLFQVDDQRFFHKLYHLFCQSCGRSVQELGELDLDLC